MNGPLLFRWLGAGFEWALQNSLAGTVVAGVVFLLHLVFRKRMPIRLSYSLWICVLVRLALPVVPASHFSVFNLVPAVDQTSQPHALSEPTLRHALPTNARSVSGGNAPLLRQDARSAFPAHTLALLWITGVLAYLVLVLRANWSLHRALAVQNSVACSRALSMLTKGMKLFKISKRIELCEMAEECAPAIFGFFRPRLLISRTLLEQLTDAELRMVIWHELAHVKRKDVVLNWGMILIQALHWFNPLAWLAMRQLRTSREMVCDARVLSLTREDERREYGATLIKIAAALGRQSSTPGLVAIFGNKKEIHRRILMLTQYKPMTRLAAVLSMLMLVGVIIFMITGAGKRSEQVQVSTRADQPPAEMAKSNRDLDKLRKAAAEQGEQVALLADKLDRLKSELNISEGDQESKTDALRQLGRLSVEARTEYQQLASLTAQLEKMSPSQLIQTLPTASPDMVLGTLLNQLASAEQKAAELSGQFGAEHSEVKRSKTVRETIEMQIKDRCNGILQGLKARTSVAKDKLKLLDEELSKAKAEQVERPLRERRYFALKRELETQLQLQSKLNARLEDEQIEAMLKN
jgi:bla regulator protein BlaR1